jgi:class 3 adenylate cyclase/tetratricopeptide (TPR) repeat protein
MPLCSTCGQDNPDGFLFCGRCGSPLAGSPPEREVRKTVTLLFCDVSGSTALGEQLDPETLRRVMQRYFDVMSGVIERHGGTVEKFAGDAVMAVFGVPQVREDDALRAVRAAAEIRASLPALAAELGVELVFRTGVNTGEVVVGAGQTLATGDAVNVAARLEQAAAPGEILIGAQTHRLVRDAVQAEAVEPLSLRGKAETVTAHRLLAVVPGAPGLERALTGRMIGREAELRLLKDVFERVVEERRCQLFTLLGAAGVGKSRLVRAFLEDAGGSVARGRCLPYGEGITFSPLIEVLGQLGEPAAEMLAHVTGGGAASAGELFFEVRRTLERIGSERPLIVVLDDLHWAEPTLLDLLDHVADLSRGVPILLLCIARPELLEERPSWAGGKLNATTALLEPLPREASERLIEHLAGRLDADARARVIAAAEGNPLFLEEMVAFTLEGGGSEVPPTIQALLAARIERLAEPERGVLERGAVEGKVFHRRPLRDLAPAPLQATVDASLAALVRMELIRPEAALFEHDDAFRFRHLLIRDAAYDSLPKARRAQLHAAFAGWLEQNSQALAERDEITGWHLEQALGYRRELAAPLDPELAERACEHLLAAGERAGSRGDYGAAENLLRRALALAQKGRQRGRAALALADGLLEHGRLDQLEALLDEAEADPAFRSETVLVRVEWMMHSRPHEVTAYARRELPAAMAEFERRGDHRLLAKALVAKMLIGQLDGILAPGVENGLAAIEHARQAGDRGLLTKAAVNAKWALVFGPADVDTTARLGAAIDSNQPGPSYEAFDYALRGFLVGRAGAFDEARTLFARSREMLDQLGMQVHRSAMSQITSRVELEAGNVAAAVAQLETAIAELEHLGERSYRATCRAQLAEALYWCGRSGEAEAAARAVESESAPEDVINFAIAHGVLARIAADRGDRETALRLADSAVGHAFQMDMPATRADALCVRAHVLRAAGRLDEAENVLAHAIAIYERKGELAAAAWARASLMRT